MLRQITRHGMQLRDTRIFLGFDLPLRMRQAAARAARMYPGGNKTFAFLMEALYISGNNTHAYPLMTAVPFPLVEIRFVANVQNEWVALLLCTAGQPGDGASPQALSGVPDLLAAIAPLDCIVQVDHLSLLTPSVLELMPPNRVVLAVPAQALAGDGAARRLAELQTAGWRVLLDGMPPAGIDVPPALRMRARDCASGAPAAGMLPLPSGPHLAYGVATRARQQACAQAGFGWFSGAYMFEAMPDGGQSDADQGTSRRRLLAMLALLARDADSREIEVQLKQDPGLSYHLLKLVNSAAFSCGTPVTSFGQAISRMGRRQLQRWLQLLLYAHRQPDSQPNLLLPLAALRGAALEALCKRDGLDRDAQDLAFMAGVFSLLDRLFHMPMQDVVRDLNLPAHVEDALLHRRGRLGRRLRLLEADRPDAALLDEAGVEAAHWWQDQLQAYRWAIQVARNV
jgi:EAL and modified HD-GYP domain-containing signal transduction protein